MGSSGISEQLGCIFVIASVLILFEVNEQQSSPYMDEIFHIRQTKHYCAGNFSEWDDKITTPPGLYLFTVGLGSMIAASGLISMELLCTVPWLRSINILFAVGNHYLVTQILERLHSKSLYYSEKKVAATATNLALLPVLYFFTFLFYTDAGSLFFVLLMYLLSKQDRHVMAACVGAISVFFRQTNIIWVFFTASTVLLWVLREYTKTEESPGDPWRRHREQESAREYVAYLWRTSIYHKEKGLGKFIKYCTAYTWPYVLVGAAFLGFLVWNNGVVLGDRSAHKVSFHAPQLLYFALFSGVFASPHYLAPSAARRTLRSLAHHPLLTLTLTLLTGLALARFTHAHPYLLSDNRHYTFYAWRRLLGATPLRYALTPLYVVVAFSMWNELDPSECCPLWKLLFFACVGLATVPQRLLEFRYFITPFLMLRLHMPLPRQAASSVLEFVLFAAVNAATLKVFLHRTFRWPDSDEVQRFMW